MPRLSKNKKYETLQDRSLFFLYIITYRCCRRSICRLEEEEKKISSKMNDSLPIRFESMNNTQVLLTERNLSKKNTLCPLYMNFTLVSTVIKHVV